MNWLLLVVLVVLGFYVWRGYHNGLVKTVFAIFTMIIALIAATVFSPFLSNVLQDNESIYGFIEEKVNSVVNVDQEVQSKAEEQLSIDNMPFPDYFKEVLFENNNNVIYDEMNISNFDDYISGYITRMILNALSYFIIFLTVFIVLKVIANILDIISKLPIINAVNKMAGLAVGLIQGLIVIWILCIILNILSSTELGNTLFKMVSESPVLSFIYNNNLLVHYVMGFNQSIL